MHDTAYKNAEERRAVTKRELDAAQARVRALTDEMDRIDRFLSDYREFAGLGEDAVAHDASAAATEATPKKRPQNPPKEEIGDIVEKIIENRGRPVSRDLLYAGLEAEGIHLEGSDPKMVLSTMLWRMKDRFIRLKPHGYWLTRLDFEEGGYIAALN